MCGRFALFHSREEYLTALQLPVIVNKTVDTPKWCYNISPGTNVVIGVGLDIENYCTLRLFFDLSTLAGLSRRNFPEAGIRLLFQI